MTGGFEPPPPVPPAGRSPRREGCWDWLDVLDVLDPLDGCCDALSFFDVCSLTLLALLPQLLAVLVWPSRHPQGRVIGAIGIYQRRISPQLPARCRFTPTCSHYAVEAVATRGLLRGGWLALRRLIRCRPGAAGGSDPVA